MNQSAYMWNHVGPAQSLWAEPWHRLQSRRHFRCTFVCLSHCRYCSRLGIRYTAARSSVNGCQHHPQNGHQHAGGCDEILYMFVLSWCHSLEDNIVPSVVGFFDILPVIKRYFPYLYTFIKL